MREKYECIRLLHLGEVIKGEGGIEMAEELMELREGVKGEEQGGGEGKLVESGRGMRVGMGR